MSQYIKGVSPLSQPDQSSYIDRELTKIEKAFVEPSEFLALAPLYASPSKIREGMIVFADGTSFNPGSGGGVYCYRAGSWRFLG